MTAAGTLVQIDIETAATTGLYVVGTGGSMTFDRSTGVLAILDGSSEPGTVLFGQPASSSVANPPVNSNAGNATAHPVDGRIFLVEFDAVIGKLVGLVGDRYVTIGSFDSASHVFGVAFGAIRNCPGDVNTDNTVDLSDLIAVAGASGPCV